MFHKGQAIKAKVRCQRGSSGKFVPAGALGTVVATRDLQDGLEVLVHWRNRGAGSMRAADLEVA